MCSLSLLVKVLIRCVDVNCTHLVFLESVVETDRLELRFESDVGQM